MSESMFRQDGKVAVVTGAARGIGAATAATLARAGAHVAISDLAGHDLASTASSVEAHGSRVFAHEMDVRDARQIREGFAAIDWTLAHAADWQVPLLIVHGTGDPVVPAAASTTFFEQVTIADKQRIEYEGGYHESHNDIHHEQMTADLAGWLEAHLS